MTVYEYRTRLLAALADYDAVEVVNAANYYAELIEDADDPDEQMRKLGSPEELAKMIIESGGWDKQKQQRYYEQAQSSGIYYDEPPRRANPGAGRVIALILTFPLWITVYALIFSLFVTVIALMIALPLGFIAIMIEGITSMATYIPYGIELMFTALMVLGLFVITAAAARPLLSGTGGLFGKFSRFLFGSSKEEGLTPHVHKGVNKAALVIGAVMLVAGIVGTAVTDTQNMRNIEKFTADAGIDSFDIAVSEVPDRVYADIETGKLNIGRSTDGKVHLRCEQAIRDRLSVTEGNTLDIRYALRSDLGLHTGLGFEDRFHVNYDPTFTLLLPSSNTYEEIHIEVDLGGLRVEDVNSDIITITNLSGTTTMRNCTADDISIDNDLGSLKCENVKAEHITTLNGSGRTSFDNCVLSGAEINNELGGINLRNCSLGLTTIENSSGSTELENCIQESDLIITNDLGNVKIDESVVDCLTVKCSSGRFKMKESAIKTSADIDLDLGNVEMDLVNGSYAVDATTDLGKAKVNDEDASKAPAGTIPVSVRSDSGNIDITLR